MKKLWVEKYRPKNLSNYIFESAEQKTAIVNMIQAKSIPHLLLSGPPGTGKTSLANLLIQDLDIDETDVLRINASDENSVDTMRETIKTFISSHALSSFKIIFLNEADYISLNGQAIMRVLMEEFAESARFILTCNYEHKIIPAIKSRCQQFLFQGGDKTEISEHVAKILIEENVDFEIETLINLVDRAYPDVRKIINTLQQNVFKGTLKDLFASSTTNTEQDILNYLNKGDWKKLRTIISNNVTGEQYETIYRLIYDNIEDLSSFSDEAKLEESYLTIAEHLYKHNFVADPEINMIALFVRLASIVR